VSSRVSISTTQRQSTSHTFVISVQDILVGVSQGKLIRDGRLPSSVWWSAAVRAFRRNRLEEFPLCLWGSAWPLVSPFPSFSCQQPHLAQASSFPAGASRSICCPAWASISPPSPCLCYSAGHGAPARGSWMPHVRSPLRRCCGARNAGTRRVGEVRAGGRVAVRGGDGQARRDVQ